MRVYHLNSKTLHTLTPILFSLTLLFLLFINDIPNLSAKAVKDYFNLVHLYQTFSMIRKCIKTLILHSICIAN